MAETRQHLALTYEGAATVLAAAVRRTEEIGARQCIAVTDDGGYLLAFGRTDGGKATNLRGGLPIVVDGHLIGAIGVGSGTGEQDVEVAAAGVAALAGAKDWTNE
ncbi:MAG TPA: heme-binding protein [Actinomycetota bacterium]|nr:heme-binding protein [Actinomycetota bacterium]